MSSTMVSIESAHATSY